VRSSRLGAPARTAVGSQTGVVLDEFRGIHRGPIDDLPGGRTLEEPLPRTSARLDAAQEPEDVTEH
jgi:hypothetical protein